MLFELYKRPTFITYGASGSGRSLVNSVNEKSGAVVLDASDIPAVADRNYVTDAQLAAIGTGGTDAGAFATLADLGAASDLAVGDLVQTKGYYFAGDAGWATYRIVAGGRFSADGGSVVDLSVSGLQAKAVFGSSVSLDQFGAIGDGATSATQALLAADTAGLGVTLSAGRYLIDQSITLTHGVNFAGGQIVIADGVTVSMPYPNAGLDQIFDLLGTGSVRITSGLDVHPEWWGDGADAVQNALDQSPTSARILLQAREYPSNGLRFVGDTQAADGGHSGKRIVGQVPAQSMDAGAGFFGSRIRLVAGANVPVMDVLASTGTSVTGGIENVTLDANKAEQTFSDVDGFVVTDVSGFEIDTVQIRNAPQDGLAFLGTQNDIVITGQVEISGSGRDGLNGYAIGTSQFNGTIKSHSNGRHGVNMGLSGQLNAQFIHCYKNLGEGVRWACENPSYIHLLRCEDNGLTGLFYTGDALVIGTAILPDNGITATTTTTQCGVSDQGQHLRIRTLSNPARHGDGIVHNQKTLYFGNSIGAVVQTVFDTATQANKVTAGQTLNIFNSKRNLLGPKIIERRSYSGSLTDHNAVQYGFRPIQCPDIYGAVHISDIAHNYFVANTNFSRSAHGSQLELRFSATASGNLNWDSSYLNADGNPMNATAMTAGNDYDFAFIRRAAFWFLIP